MAPEAVAVTAIIMTFGLVGLTLSLLTYFLVQTMRLRSQREYRDLAEQAVRSQTEMVESTAETNRLLREIERLLKEV